MKATEAKKIADNLPDDGVEEIFERIKKNAESGKYQLLLPYHITPGQERTLIDHGYLVSLWEDGILDTGKSTTIYWKNPNLIK